MRLHAIVRVPRSGSTLLCNLLNQNPRFRASGSSPGANIAATLSASLSVDEFFRRKIREEGGDAPVSRTIKAAVESLYSDTDGEVIFDKSPGWAALASVFSRTWPDGKIIITVRDPASVLASIEKRHRETGAITLPGIHPGADIRTRMQQQLSIDGVVGQVLVGVCDVVDRNFDNVLIIPYETLTVKPEATLKSLYSFIGEEYFEGHQFDDVYNLADDDDGDYLFKYPHTGSGPVRPSDPHEWRKYLPSDTKRWLKTVIPRYMEIGGYND